MAKSRIILVGFLISSMSLSLWAQGPLGASTDTGVFDLITKGQLAFKKADYALAEQNYLQALNMKSHLEEYIRFQLALSELKLNKNAEAQLEFEKVLQLSPNLKMQFDSEMELAKILILQKKFAQGRNYLLKIEKRQRRESIYPEILFQLARAEKGLEQPSQYCPRLRKLYSRYPDFAPIQNWTLYLREDLFEGEKTNCLTTREEQRARIKNLQWAGLSQKAQSEIEELKKLKVIEPSEVESLEISYLMHEGEVTKALNLLLARYEDKKNDFDYLMTLASASARAGELQVAVGSYYKAYQIGGKSKDAKNALYQAAFLSYQFQDYDGAARRFQEFMKVFSSSGLTKDAKWHLAWIRYLRGDFEGSYKSFRDLAQTSTSSRKKTSIQDRSTYWMAMSLYRQKKFDEAKVLFELLSKDQLVGYYSIAAQNRLKKMESFTPPKKIKRGAVDATRRLARFSMGETLIPADDVSFMPISEDAESEENLTGVTKTLIPGAGPDDVEKTSDEAAGDLYVETAPQTEESDVRTSFANPVLVKRFERARDLMILGERDWAKWDLYDIERKTSNREYLRTLMSEYENVENYNRSSYIGQVYFGPQRAAHGIQGVRYLWESTYPKAFEQDVLTSAKRFEIPTEFIWGIMRAESQYKKDVVSPVGALGLMQVMPLTAQKISEMMGEKSFQSQSLLQPPTAIKIGARYLSRLMKKFEASIPLAAAGYNAGPHRVKSWLVSFGERDMDEFIEHIPFVETRNYVKKVISNYVIYSQLYGISKAPLSSLADLNKVRVHEQVSAKETWEDI